MIKYLAIPYSYKVEDLSLKMTIEKLRFDISNCVASILMKRGEIIFSPISHTHPMVEYGLPTDWEYWKTQDVAFLDVCGAFYVVTLIGWDKSTGVKNEISHMHKRGIEVVYIDPKDFNDEKLNAMVVLHDALLNKHVMEV
jgi:hypothetical protein